MSLSPQYVFDRISPHHFLNAMSTPLKRLPKSIWIAAYLISPAAPFVCLRLSKAIYTLHCVLGVLTALFAHIGLVSVLAHTNGQKLQIFIVLLLSESIYLVCLWQYLAGHAVSLWSAEAEYQWKLAGRIFGALIFSALIFNILIFHLFRN